jgi:hypothetical protein
MRHHQHRSRAGRRAPALELIALGDELHARHAEAAGIGDAIHRHDDDAARLRA